MCNTTTKISMEEMRECLLLGLPYMTQEFREKTERLRQQILTNPNKNQSSHSDVLQSVLNKLKKKTPVLLVGPAGCGKSTLLRKVAKQLRYKDEEYCSIPVNGYTTVYDIVGYNTANGVYIGTAFRKAYQNGGFVVLDELDAGNPNVLTVIHQALDKSGFYWFPDGMVKRHKRFRLCAAANTYGHGPTWQYIGRNPLDAATVDRFGVVDVDYDEDLERKIGPVKEWTLFIQALRHTVSNWDDHIPPVVISTRAVVDGGYDVKSGTDWDSALHSFVWRGVALKPEVIEAMKREAFELLIKNYYYTPKRIK